MVFLRISSVVLNTIVNSSSLVLSALGKYDPWCTCCRTCCTTRFSSSHSRTKSQSYHPSLSSCGLVALQQVLPPRGRASLLGKSYYKEVSSACPFSSIAQTTLGLKPRNNKMSGKKKVCIVGSGNWYVNHFSYYFFMLSYGI